MSYLQMVVPPRSAHLWRYTPWNRIHPTKPDELPDVDPLKFEIEGCVASPFERATNESDIARAFLHEVGGEAQKLTINGKGEVIHIRARASGHIAVGHLDLDVKGEATIILHLSGEPGWCGIHLSGTIHPNAHLGFGFINELDQSTK
ncbi:hypothetical protein N9X72_01745, partial [Candidatus Poseidoniales archaeon]|nr:hypothetical protein [Candidatus Poseidoniales archaeon]